MPGEALLIGIATIAVVVAGFTGVTSTLVPPGGSWHPAMRIRQRAIVSTSFNVMFESLAPFDRLRVARRRAMRRSSWPARAWPSMRRGS